MTSSEHKKQIIIIHGGDSYDTYEDYLRDLKQTVIDYDRLKPSKKWRDSVVDSFPDCDVLTPTMPNSSNANYDEWQIWFEKLLPYFGDDVRLIGHSLGAMFLAKYLHANQLTKPVRQLILLAGGYDKPGEVYGSFKVDSATGLERSAQQVHLFHSRDDFVVDFSELAKFQADLPSADSHIFDDRNHFLDPEFPELIELLRQK